MTHATLNFYPRKDPRMRFFALWYFTILLIAWTILGDTVLGFEQSMRSRSPAYLPHVLLLFSWNGWTPA